MKYLLLTILIIPSLSNCQPLLADSIINATSIRHTLSFLSNDDLKGRLTGSEGAGKAAAFIADQFKAIGLDPGGGSNRYLDSFPVSYKGKKVTGINVMAALNGKSTNDTMVIFSAHYDHIGEKDDLDTHKPYDNKDFIFNGANDNATGVTALIELARYYKALNNNCYRLLFVAFAGEEMVMLGSEHLMKKTDSKKVKAVVNLEMLGRQENGSCFIVSFRNSSIRNMLNDHLKQSLPGTKKFFQTDPYPDENLAYRSDHYPFSRKIKNAFTIMGTSPADEYYHSADDEYETIDIDFLLRASKNIALACELFIR